MVRIIIAVVVIVLLLPLLSYLKPGPPITLERVEDAFQAAGYEVANVTPTQVGFYEAAEGWDMTVSGASVTLCRYTEGAKLTKHVGYHNPDSGSLMVESWGLLETLPAAAAKPSILQNAAVSNGMFMLVVRSDDKGLRDALIRVFQSM